MLDTIGAPALEDLYAHLPEDVRFRGALNIPSGKSEYDIVDYFRRRGRENANEHANFLGAGVYHHYRPVLVDAIVSRGATCWRAPRGTRRTRPTRPRSRRARSPRSSNFRP